MKLENTADEKSVGIELSQSTRWDGLAIMRVAEYALTDANFHAEAKQIRGMIEAYERSNSSL